MPCKARCPVVSPGHFSLLKIPHKITSAPSSFQLGDWLRSSSLRLGNHFHQSAIHCSTLQGRGSLMAKVSNQSPEKIHMEKKSIFRPLGMLVDTPPHKSNVRIHTTHGEAQDGLMRFRRMAPKLSVRRHARLQCYCQNLVKNHSIFFKSELISDLSISHGSGR